MPAMLLVLAATGVLRGLQDTRTPLVVARSARAANVVLNLVLVYGVGLGHRRLGARHGARPAGHGGGARRRGRRGAPGAHGAPLRPDRRASGPPRPPASRCSCAR